jgi:signal transduction histidine kinase
MTRSAHNFRIPPILFSPLGILIFTTAFSLLAISAAETNKVLTTAAEILSPIVVQSGQNIPVLVTGVVTVAESNWHGMFFVQDSTGGVFVNATNPPPAIGDLVKVSGIRHPGGYAPDIESPSWTQLGTAPLPEAKLISAEQFMSGTVDGLRVEVSGVVRSAQSQSQNRRLVAEVASGGYRFQAFAPISTNVDLNSLVGATVRIRGTAAASFNAPLRQMLTMAMFVPRESDLIVDQLPDTSISEAPFAPLRRIAQYHHGASPTTRIRVKGVVTYQRRGADIFLNDGADGLQVKSRDTNSFTSGEMIEAIGFPGVERFLPVLRDAILIRTKEAGKHIVPNRTSVQELLSGTHHGDLVSLQGKLLDRSLRPLRVGNPSSDASGANVLTLQNGNYLFSVEAPPNARFDELGSLPVGSTLEVSGLCLLQVSEEGKVEGVRILLPDVASVHILQRSGWWTPERLLIGLAILLVVSGVGAIWTLMILRKNSALKSSIAEKIRAQNELQKAHDQLESRVEERTKQLNFEMTARKEMEVRFEATVAERTRLAQELHDTLLQGFTGIGLKLDAVTSSLPASLAATKKQLEKILEQSDEYLVEARRSVWALRAPSVEGFEDFSDVLTKVSERALHGSDIELRFTTSGDACKPSPIIEDNLRRICEEAVTNAVKHARPTHVEVHLEYAPDQLKLQIRDDGCGFDPKSPNATKDGHFGLVGIHERAKSIDGNISLNSQPGRGTQIVVTVSLSA